MIITTLEIIKNLTATINISSSNRTTDRVTVQVVVNNSNRADMTEAVDTKGRVETIEEEVVLTEIIVVEIIRAIPIAAALIIVPIIRIQIIIGAEEVDVAIN